MSHFGQFFDRPGRGAFYEGKVIHLLIGVTAVEGGPADDEAIPNVPVLFVVASSGWCPYYPPGWVGMSSCPQVGVGTGGGSPRVDVTTLGEGHFGGSAQLEFVDFTPARPEGGEVEGRRVPGRQFVDGSTEGTPHAPIRFSASPQLVAESSGKVFSVLL